jgi:chromosomal replication initiation ATPase DnaA
MSIAIDQNRERVLIQRTIRHAKPPVRQVMDLVGQRYGVDPDAMLGRQRHAEIAWPRQVAHWIIYQLGYSLPKVGQALGRTHSAILHSIRTVAGYRDAYPEIHQETDAILQAARELATTGTTPQSAIRNPQ